MRGVTNVYLVFSTDPYNTDSLKPKKRLHTLCKSFKLEQTKRHQVLLTERRTLEHYERIQIRNINNMYYNHNMGM